MKAWGLTISIPCNKCDKNCLYCISEMTGFVDADPMLVERNLEKVLTTATAAQVSTVLLTSKREPMLNREMVLSMARKFMHLPVEVQTNGIWLHRHPTFTRELYEAGVNIIAFSIDKLEDLEKYKDTFAAVAEHKMVVRVCLNLTDMIPQISFSELFNHIENAGNVRQLLVRNVMCPSNVTEGDEHDWISLHTSQERYKDLAQQFIELTAKKGLRPIRTFPFGMSVYGLDGISVGFSDYCIQESNNTTDVRSLIYLEDGHLYTSWGDPASILF